MNTLAVLIEEIGPWVLVLSDEEGEVFRAERRQGTSVDSQTSSTAVGLLRAVASAEARHTQQEEK